MAELVVSPVLQVVFDRLASPLLEKLGSMWHLTDNFRNLQRSLVYGQVILEDAEEKQVTDRDVKTWLSELKRVVYEAEDLLDEITVSGALVDSSGDLQGSSGMKLELLGTQYAERVREMVGLLEKIRDEGSKFNLRESSWVHARRETSSFVIESEVYGRENDKEKIVEMLLSSEAKKGGEVSCIPIVGLGGIGKTTLAQLVFNDERVTQYFDVKVWSFVSDCFDAKNIMMSIIESVTKGKSHYSTMDALHSQVWGLLNKKRYLIVLDDVWTEDPDEWEKLRPIFRGDVDGSKIIITTRSKKVALAMDSPIFPYYLKGLSEEACWSLFVRRAFQRGEEMKHSNLVPIGREIVKKCGGVALAAKALGSLLRFKREERQWLVVQNSELWNLDEPENGIIPALRLSYLHLPPRLKRCFIFCSVFPRRYEINKEKLIRLWMAGGLIQYRGDYELEDTANDYFNDLLWMSFFQEVKQCDNGGVIGYRMHDIIYDLAQSVAGTEFVILDHSFLPKNFSQVRHASVVCDFRSSVIPKELYEARRLRSLFLFSIGDFSEASCKLFSSFKYLRELDLSGCGLMSLDDMIGDLACLSYLDLSNTHIKTLPRKIEKLHFLQTLNLAGCYNLVALPNLANMSRLRHLNNSGCTSLTTMLPVYEPFNQLQTHPSPYTQEHRKLVGRAVPPYSNQLQTLPLFVIGVDLDRMLLERLKLRGSLKITHIENLRYTRGVKFGLLMGMEGLDSLGLYWGGDQDCSNINPEEESAVSRFLERKEIHSSGPSSGLVRDALLLAEVAIERTLQPHQNLKRLVVKGYPGYMFPSWIYLINLTVVELIDCGNCEFLPTLGNLPLLKSLLLQSMDGVRHIGKEFYGESTRRPFLVLRELVLVDFPNLEEWIGPDGGDVFPSLCKLIIKKCPKLKAIPEIISSVEHLELRDCPASLVHYFQNLVSLTVLVVQHVKELSSFPGVFPANNPLLTSLEILSFPQLILLPSEIGKLTSLKSLKILWCEQLSSLPQDIQNLNALESLEIGDCHSLMFLPEIGPGGLSNLRTLSIENCSNLTSLPMGLQHLTSLEHLTIMYCPSLIALPQGIQKLSALQSLTVLSCAEFSFLPDGLQNLMELRSLEIRSCPSLNVLPEWIEKLVSLRSLAISDCHNIKVLPEGIKRLTALQHLSIQDCSELLKRCTPESGEDWPKICHVPYKHMPSPEQKHPSEASIRPSPSPSPNHIMFSSR